MKNHRLFLICFILVLLFPLGIKAQDTLVYPTDSSFLDIAPYCWVYKDEKGALDFEQIKNLPDSLFKKMPSGSLSFGSTNASIWVKFTLKNQTTEPLYLTFWGWGIDSLDVFTINENGELNVRHTGAKRHLMTRDLKRGHIALNIGQSPKDVYISLKSSWMINTLVSISTLIPLSNKYYGRDTFNGICMGILLAMALYNLFLYFSVRERLYLYYFAYIILALVMVAELNSTYRFFIGWGQAQGLRELTFIMGIIFSMRFLNTRNTIPWGHKLLWSLIVLFILYGACSLLGLKDYLIRIYQLPAVISIFLIPTLAFLAYRRGNKSALFFFIAWFFLLVSGFITVLTTNGIIPFTFWTNSVFAIGTCLETILLAFALAYRLKTYRDESKSAQELAIQRLEENERLVKEQNKVLEENVLERTAELQHSLEALKATQNQLIQSEKLASLGELTAGIAHEIQNPLNFVNNFSELSVDLVKDLKDEIGKTDLDKAYIEELFDDLSSNQEKINHHGKRASSIVKGMLEHSRASTGERTLTDINQLADEYLRLSYHGLRAKDKNFNADFKTDFETPLPKIAVVPQDIGRVLLNLFNNAFYAAYEKSKQAKGENYVPSVIVSTQQLGNIIEIRVKDNGTGMPEAVKAKIFQPFFTTKPTGQGTGLGLSLSYDIVVKGHGGSFEVQTTEGAGTEFIIRLELG
ncbi:MAG TPA: 7TM diverse intracellular signaling domain-containing protein [Saprospiraceae bacterium]|nr:7TM diverse intracellular signaling domain-containing protein [Saprospiraceae bacterium]